MCAFDGALLDIAIRFGYKGLEESPVSPMMTNSETPMTTQPYRPKENGPRPVKAYKNATFLSSPDARTIRVLCEFVEPKTRFQKHRASNTVVFFGSARALPMDLAEQHLVQAERDASDDGADAEENLARARKKVELARYYEDARLLAGRITEWSKTIRPSSKRLLISSGGGPGIMEAANRGAAEAGGQSIGLNISLPHEQEPNPYQSPELSFEFHYFFIRKFWFVYPAKAIVVFPGGFGTLDELLELLTLVQTKTICKPLPIVIYGSRYWREVLNWDAMVQWGTISPEDLELFRFCDSVDEAFEFLREELTKHHLNKRR